MLIAIPPRQRPDAYDDRSSGQFCLYQPLRHCGRASQQTLADGTSTWQFAYTTDSNNNVTQATITDPNGIVEQRNFAEFHDAGSSSYSGFLSSDVRAVWKPEQQTTTFTRDPNTNLLSSSTDQLGRETSYTYDSLGNILTITRLVGTQQAVTTTYTYTPTFSETRLDHRSTWSPVDARLRQPQRSDQHHRSAQSSGRAQLQLHGSADSIADALNNTTQFTYSYGDLSQVIDPLGNATSLFHDSVGRLGAITDALGNQTQLTYDNLDRITQILDALSGATAFSYDGNGNLLSLTDANSNKTTYTYDKRNERLTRTDALAKSESYGYDANGNLTQHTDRRGTVDTYSYDGLNRRTSAGFGKNGSKYQDTISYTFECSLLRMGQREPIERNYSRKRGGFVCI